LRLFQRNVFKRPGPKGKNVLLGGAEWNAKCPKETIDQDKYKIISCQVVDEKGNILGEEKLPFSLIENGIMLLIDSI
jgi:hypothetical protein